jgi:hypothetical protein
MLRPRAVRALLVEEVAGLRRGAPPPGEPGEPGEPGAAESEPEAAEQDIAERRDQERELVRAGRRALGVAIACVAAVAVLFALRDPARAWLSPGRGEEGAFTIGILLVTAYAGFRLAQYLHLRTVARLHRELAEREE